MGASPTISSRGRPFPLRSVRPCQIFMRTVLLLAGILIASDVALQSRGHEGSNPGQGPTLDRPVDRVAFLPSVIIWAWDRPEDLRFLRSKGIGVSFLAETLTLSGDTVRMRPRLHPLKVTPGTPLIACARVETDTIFPPTLTAGQVSAAASALARLTALDGVIAIQVDFDATRSERTFYAALLRELRRQPPPTMPLSITALASWCAGDPWIASLPIDEAVPMLFRMGPDAQDVRLALAQGVDFSLPVCRKSVGISTDETIPTLPSGRRRYVFRPEGWSQAAVRSLLAEEGKP